MVTGFAAGGLVDLVPALAVMLGANVGTTLIVQVLSFNVNEVAPALILIGVLMFRRTSAGPRDFGRVLIGLGLLLMALRQFVGLLDPIQDAPNLRLLMGAVATQPVLDVILAAGLTWAAHSSVAVVLLTMSFAAKGVVPPDAAFALVLGANLGTAINPVLEGGAGDDRAARLLVEEKEMFRSLEAEATAAHFEHLREGRVGSVETSALHLDALRDLKRVNAHLVAAAAYPVLEGKGELLPSRLR